LLKHITQSSIASFYYSTEDVLLIVLV